MDLYSKEKQSFRNSKKSTFTEKVYEQIGALCFKVVGGKVLVLLITSRGSKRWIIPKGWKLDKLSNRKSAALEAWEEAGVQGRVGSRSLGNYYYRKSDNTEDFFTCSVRVFAIKVSQKKKKFPEQGQRKSKWVEPAVAITMVAEPELKSIIKKITQKKLKKLFL